MASLSEILDQLERHYGTIKRPEINDPFELILWENVAYPVEDERLRSLLIAMSVPSQGIVTSTGNTTRG